MKKRILNKSLTLSVLLLILVSCQGKNETVVEQNPETKQETKVEETKEREEIENKTSKTDDISKTILSDLANLFEKFNPKNDDFRGVMVEIDSKLAPNSSGARLMGSGMSITSNSMVDDDYDIINSYVSEDNESSVEPFINTISEIFEEVQGIDKKDFHDKAIEEYKQQKGKEIASFQYKTNKALLPINVNWFVRKADGKLAYTAAMSSIRGDYKNNKEGIVGVSHEYLNKRNDLLGEDLTYNMNKINLFNNFDSDSLEDYDFDIEDLENDSDGDISSADTFNELQNIVSSWHKVCTLEEEDLSKFNVKNKNEIYQTTIYLSGTYDTKLEDFIKEFDEVTTKVPEETKAKLGEMKELIKKQHTNKSQEIKDENFLAYKGFVFASSVVPDDPERMVCILTIITDGDGNLIDREVDSDLIHY